MAQKLLGTGDAELVEGSLCHDIEYGVCFYPRCGGQGQNLVGRVLMQVRDDLRVPAAEAVTA